MGSLVHLGSAAYRELCNSRIFTNIFQNPSFLIPCLSLNSSMASHCWLEGIQFHLVLNSVPCHLAKITPFSLIIYYSVTQVPKFHLKGAIKTYLCKKAPPPFLAHLKCSPVLQEAITSHLSSSSSYCTSFVTFSITVSSLHLSLLCAHCPV